MIASDVLLLLLDDETGKSATESSDAVVTGGVLSELALAGRIRLTEGDHPDGAGRVEVVHAAGSASTVGDPLLDEALGIVMSLSEQKAPKVGKVVQAVRAEVTPKVAERLVEEGVLVREERGRFSLSRTPRYVEGDGTREHGLRERLAEVLAERRAATPEEAAVIGLVYASEAVGAVLGPDLPDLDGKTLVARAEPYAKGSWAADQVSRQVAAFNASVISTVMTASIGASSSIAVNTAL